MSKRNRTGGRSFIAERILLGQLSPDEQTVTGTQVSERLYNGKPVRATIPIPLYYPTSPCKNLGVPNTDGAKFILTANRFAAMVLS